MKKITVLFGLTFLLVFWLEAQEIKVLDTVIIPTEQNNYTAPQFSPDGKKILFTQFGFKGLWLYDLEQKSLVQINDYTGAGYEPVFTADGKQIVFRTDEYINKRKYSSLAVQNLDDRKIEHLTDKVRHLSPAIMLNSDQLVYKVSDKVKSLRLSSDKSNQSNVSGDTYGYIDYGKIIIVNDGVQKELVPVENSDYIWFSLSPDKNEFIFTVVGGNTFIVDINGNLLADLGNANSPKWSPDGKWIVYMVDEDDGHVITASDIWTYNIENKTKTQLTKTSDIHEMYPDWSPQVDKIVCALTSGQIAVINIRIDG